MSIAISKIVFDFKNNREHKIMYEDGTEKRIGGFKLEVNGKVVELTLTRGGNKIAERRKATKALVEELGKDKVF